MKILKEIFKRPVTIFFMILIAILVGVISTTNMAVNLLPDISFPYVSVQTIYAGADAKTVDSEITQPLENQLSRISGIHEISTYSLDNASMILLQFDYGTDIDKKRSDIESIIREFELPENAQTPKTSLIDLNATSMYSLTVYSDSKPMEDVYKEAERVMNSMQSIDGVGSVKLSGAPSLSVRVDMINGLEMFAGLLVEDLTLNSSLDIPLGEMMSSDGKITITNHSKAETIDLIKNTMIGVDLTNAQMTYLRSVQELIKNLETMNVEELEKMKSDADDMNMFIDKLYDMNDEELDDLVLNIQEIKSLVETIEGNTAAGLKLMWSQMLKGLFEDETFNSLTDDELREMSDRYGVSYGLLKWARDNSNIEPISGKTYAELKWNKIVAFREANPNEIDDSLYASLFYDIELVSNDPIDEDYMSEDDITDAVRLSRSVNTVALQNVVDTLKDEEEPSNQALANLFIYQGNEYDIPLTGTTIRMIRDEHFETNYKVFHSYKILHEHEEEIVDEDAGTTEIVKVGDDISSEDFIAIYNQMEFDEEPELKPTVRLLDFIREIDFANSKIKMKVEKMADVYLDTRYESIAYYNSNQAIQIDIYGDQNSNATAIAENAKKIIKAYKDKGEGFDYVSLNNQADFINDSLSNALVSLLIGSLLAVIVIYLFLRKVKSSLIIAISMPLSVLLTLACLHLMGITLNMVSVGGIAVGIGMLVDNSIVVLESITSEKEKGKDILDASVDGVKLVLGSLIGSTITSVCVFFPILLMEGLTKEIFADLSWAVIFSLSFSLIVAITVIPTLFSLFFKKEEKKKGEAKIFNKLNKWYIGKLKVILKHKGITIITVMLIFIASIGLIFTCPIEFLPSIDQHKVQINVNFEAGTEDKYVQEKTQEAYDIIMENIDDIEYMSDSIGFNGLIETTKSGTILVQLKDDAKNSKYVVEDIRELLYSKGFDADFSVVELDGVVASLTGGMSGISVSIQGEDVDTLKEIASKIEEDVTRKDGIKHASDNMLSVAKSYEVVFDQDKLIENGVDYKTAVMTLRIGLAGYDLYEINEMDQEAMVTIKWNDNAIGEYYDSLAKLVVGISSSDDNETSFVHLEDVATINELNSRHIIRKVNGLNVLQIDVEAFGIDTNTASNYLKKSTKEVLKNYPGYISESGGVSYYLTDAFSGLIVALIISFFLLFGIMACLFESLRKPIIIIFSFPFAFAGGFLALAVTRVSLNVVSFIGLIMLMGVIINDAIVLNERFDQLRESGLDPKEAVIEGCNQRLRAVLMTTLTTVLALIPMALGLGKGGELMQPLGVVAIGGMTIGTIVTLVLIPCVYSLIYRINFKEKKIETNASSEMNKEEK